MRTSAVVQRPNRCVDDSIPPSKQPVLETCQLERNSVCRTYTIPLSDRSWSSPFESETPLDNRRTASVDCVQVDVAEASPADATCRHDVVVEHGSLLRRLALPSTTHISATQRFEAQAGDTLSYDFVVLLYSGTGVDAASSVVGATLVNVRTDAAVPLLNRSLDGCNSPRRQCSASHHRESQSFVIPAAGPYELRFATSVDPDNSGAEAHLLVDSVRVVHRSGYEVTRLASLSSVGRVQMPMSDL